MGSTSARLTRKAPQAASFPCSRRTFGLEDKLEPKGNKLPAGILVNRFDEQKNPVTGYEGPTS
jgi:hypothetical protein